MHHLFNAKCKIQGVIEPEASGTYSQTPYDKYTDVPCRIAWSQGQEKIMVGKDSWFRDAKVYCAVRDITTQDKLIYKDQEYDIVDVANPGEAGRFMVLSIKRHE
jgi:head-tail adaptor